MKSTLNKTISITVLDNYDIPSHGYACFFHVPINNDSSLFNVGDIWERNDGETFAVKSFGYSTNCWNNPYDQVAVIFESSSGTQPVRGDILYPSLWKYGIHPSKRTVEERLSFVEDIFIELGAVRTDLNKDHRVRFNEREVFEYKGEYYQVDVIGFDEKPYIVIEWIDDMELADNGVLEDVEPFPYDLSDEEIVQEIRFALGIEPYSEINDKIIYL